MKSGTNPEEARKEKRKKLPVFPRSDCSKPAKFYTIPDAEQQREGLEGGDRDDPEPDRLH
jgi:hypothetical protein